MVWATFWASFSQTHLVALLATHAALLHLFPTFLNLFFLSSQRFVPDHFGIRPSDKMVSFKSVSLIFVVLVAVSTGGELSLTVRTYVEISRPEMV
jgi:hypothetical protein